MSKVKDISRRTFLKGAGAVAASSLLPHFPNIVRADNHEINIIGWGSDFFDGLFEGATEATGIKINREGLPSRWSDVMQKFTLWGQTGYSHVDIMMTDDLLAGMYGMNGWALDLSDLNAYNDNSDDINDPVHELDNAMGGVFRLFYFMGATPFILQHGLGGGRAGDLGRLRLRWVGSHRPGSAAYGAGGRWAARATPSIPC